MIDRIFILLLVLSGLATSVSLVLFFRLAALKRKQAEKLEARK